MKVKLSKIREICNFGGQRVVSVQDNGTSRLGRCDDSVVGALPKTVRLTSKVNAAENKTTTPTLLLVSVRYQDR